MPNIIENIRDQAKNLARIAEFLGCEGRESLAQCAQMMRGIRRVAFVGVGGSRYAAMPAAVYLSKFGIDAQVLDASELLYYESVPRETAIVLVSRSGRTAELVRLAENLDLLDAPYIAVTNSPDSPMAENAAAVVPVAGKTDSGVSIRTYTGAVLTLLHLSAVMVKGLTTLQEEIDAMLPKLERRMADWERDDLSLTGSTYFCFLGRGYCLSCAAEASLLFQELARQPSTWHHSAEFRQGPIEVLKPEHSVLVFAPDGPTRNLHSALVQELHATGAKVVEVAAPWSNLPEHLAAITQIIPAQFAAWRLAIRNGGEVGGFRFAAETTESEHGAAIGR